MKMRLGLVLALTGAVTAPLRADFSYDQTSKITGGVMQAMMKVAGVFSKQAREPMRSTVAVKGDRMAHITPTHVQVIDLGKETITEVDLGKKQYSVITFADMQRALESMQKKMAEENAKRGEQQPVDMDFKASVKQTGNTRVIDGLNTTEAVMLLAMQTKDQKTGETGAMTMTSDMFLAPKMAGYDEIQKFYQQAAQKMGFLPGAGLGSAMMQSQPQLAKGFADMYKEMAKLDGVPVYQVIRMGAARTPEEAMAQATQPAGQSQNQGPSVGEAASGAAKESAANSVASRLGMGGLGGKFGGFGRKKKQDQEEQSAQPQPSAEQQQTQAGGMLLEMTMESSNFSTAALDPAKFEVPAGFKQVPSELEKELKKNR